MLDPDEEVRGAISLFFQCFGESGSAYEVVHRFASRDIRFPKRAYGGVWSGKLIWGQLSYGRALGLLKNPSYAGSYAYGRYGYKTHILEGGRIEKRTTRKPMAQWEVLIPDHHPGYIGWEEYLRNQDLLARNRTNAEEHVLSGPAREGLAQLQGLLLCARCAIASRCATKATAASTPSMSAMGNAGMARPLRLVYEFAVMSPTEP